MENHSLKYPGWQAPAEDAIAEFNLETLPGKIHAAETLILERLQQLDSGSDGAAEREAINAALNTLRVLKRERLAFPDWK